MCYLVFVPFTTESFTGAEAGDIEHVINDLWLICIAIEFMSRKVVIDAKFTLVGFALTIYSKYILLFDLALEIPKADGFGPLTREIRVESS